MIDFIRARSGDRKRLLLLVGLVLAAMLLLIGVWQLKENTSKSSDSQSNQTVSFPDYLKPDSEIKVGDSRYVSPCQVLTKDDVAKIFGEMGQDSYVSEEYLDSSVPAARIPYQTMCRYDPYITIEAEQYSDINQVKDLRSSVSSLGTEKLGDKLRFFEEAAAGTNDSKMKDFVTRLKSSSEKYQYQQTHNLLEGELAATNSDGAVVPSGQGLFSFTLLQNNIAYEIEYDTGKTAKEEFQLSSGEIARQLDKIRQVVETIRDHAQDKNLSQSPAPTILGGADKNGETKILEPCAVLSKALFQQATGKDQEGIVKRVSVPADVTRARFGSQDNVQIFPANACERQNDTSNTSVRLELQYGDSLEAVQKKLDDGFKLGPKDVALQTNAEWAAAITAIPNDPPYYMFRVGTYLGIVAVDNDVPASREAHVQAINLIVDSLETTKN